MYFIIFSFFIRAETLVPVQFWLGAFVAGRETLYLVMFMVAVFRNPAFLLVDMAATVEDCGPVWPIIYVASPEKFLMLALVGFMPGSDACRAPLFNKGPMPVGRILWAGILLFDGCGVAAISAAFGVGAPPVALVLGYSVTALSLVLADGAVLGKLLTQIRDGHRTMAFSTVFELLLFLTGTLCGGIIVPFVAARDYPDDMGKFLLHEALVGLVMICECVVWRCFWLCVWRSTEKAAKAEAEKVAAERAAAERAAAEQAAAARSDAEQAAAKKAADEKGAAEQERLRRESAGW
jgi:hypothetical protein